MTRLFLLALLVAGCQAGSPADGPGTQSTTSDDAGLTGGTFPGADTVLVIGDRRLGFVRTWADDGARIAVIDGGGNVLQELAARLPDYMDVPLSEDDRDMLPDFGYDMADYNFDGFGDLQRVRDLGAYNAVYDIWLFDPSSGQFVYDETLSDLVMPSADPENETVSSYEKSGAVYYKLTTFAWKAGTLTPIRVEERELTDSGTDVWPVTITSLPDGKVICRLEDRLVGDGMIESALIEGDPAKCPGTR